MGPFEKKYPGKKLVHFSEGPNGETEPVFYPARRERRLRLGNTSVRPHNNRKLTVGRKKFRT